MAEEVSQDNLTGVGGLDFFLFLILILVFTLNKTSFNAYFEVFDEQVNRINNIFTVLGATANGLKSTLETPQKVMKDLNI